MNKEMRRAQRKYLRELRHQVRRMGRVVTASRNVYFMTDEFFDEIKKKFNKRYEVREEYIFGVSHYKYLVIERK